MAGIDYTIPGQIRPIQIESPMNAMAQAMQLRNLQETSQMNALKAQEYGRARQEENAARKWFASGKKLDSPEALNELYSLAPGLAPTIEKNMLERGKTTAEISYKGSQKLKEDAETLDKELKNFNSFFSPLSVTSPELAEARTRAIYKNPTLKQWASRFMDEETAAKQSYNLFKTNRENWLDSQLSLDGKTIVEVTASREKKKREDDALAYSDYVRNTVLQNPDAKILSKADFLTQRGQAAVPTTAPATAPAPAAAVAPEGQVTTAPDGTKIMPAVQLEDPNLIEPAVAALLATGDPRDKELAQMIEKRIAESRKRNELTGDFQNVMVAEQRIAELEKNPTPLNKQIIASLRQQIKVANEGKAPKFNLGGITLSTEKKYGEAFAGKVADKDVELKDAAERAPEAANTANRVLGLLSSGQVITGAGANVKLQLAKWLRVAGGSENETIANTEVLLSSLADTTLGSIKSSNLGSGQGFTDKDREFLERAKAGQITYDAASLKRLAELAHRAAELTADKWNKRSKSIPKSAIEGTGISTEDIKVSPLNKYGGSDKTPPTNARGWKLEVDKSGNRAYVSPDRKQFEEVK